MGVGCGNQVLLPKPTFGMRLCGFPAALLLYPIENPATSQTTQDPGTPSRTGQDPCDVQLLRGHTAARGTVKHVTKAEIATTCSTARGALPPLSGCIGQWEREFQEQAF